MRDFNLDIGPVTARPLRSAQILRSGLSCLPTVSRRDILAGSLAFGAQAIAPNTAFSYSFTDPKIEFDDDTLAVTVGGHCWGFSRAMFDGISRLSIERHGTGCVATVSGGRFSATNLSSNLTCSIYEVGTGHWRLKLVVPSLEIADDIKLDRWLSGATLPAQGRVGLSLATTNSRHCTCLNGQVQSLDKDWRLSFKSCESLSIGERCFNAKIVALQFVTQDFSSVEPTALELQIGAATEIAPTNWLDQKLFSAKTRATQELALKVLHFNKNDSAVTVEPLNESGCITYTASTKSKGRVQLNIQNFRFVEYASRNSFSHRLVGDIADDGGYLSGDGFKFELTGARSSRAFALEVNDGEVVALNCAPRAMACSLSIEGGAALPLNLTKQFDIRLVASKDDLVAVLSGGNPSFAQTSSFEKSTIISSGGDQLINPIPHVVCATCDAEGKPDNLSFFSTHVTRSVDLLSLGYEFYNFELVTEKIGKKSKRVLRPLAVPGPSLVVVHFDPQHILEDAYNDDIGCEPQPSRIEFPVKSKLSGPTRLVFEYPKQSGPLELNLDVLVDWTKWKIQKVPDARHTRLIEEPTWNETAIELPSRIVSQPADGNHFKSKLLEPQVSEEPKGERRHALFHAELVPNDPFDPAEPSGLRRPRVVPIWTNDFSAQGIGWPAKTPAIGSLLRLEARRLGLHVANFLSCKLEQSGDRIPKTIEFQEGVSTPLEERDRWEIVRLSHDSTLCPRPPTASHFILSARGGFTHLEGYWPPTSAALAANISLERWVEDISEGQTQKEKIERRGYLFPFGHRVIYSKDTNRRIHSQSGAYYAVLKTTYFLEIRQPRIDYAQQELGGIFSDRTYQLPFRSLEIKEKVTPFLDQPQLDDEFDQKKLDVFWPTRCGELLNLTFVGTDWVGNTVKFVAPVLFVQDTVQTSDVEELAKKYQPDAIDSASEGPFRRDLAGQILALAPGYQKNDTEVQALRVDFSATPQMPDVSFCRRNPEPPHEPTPPTLEQLCKVITFEQTQLSAPFYPIVSALEAELPVLSRASSAGGGSMWMEITNPDIDGNQYEVIAVKHSRFTEAGQFALNFHEESDRSGGFAGPSPIINAVSRLKGPLGLRV